MKYILILISIIFLGCAPKHKLNYHSMIDDIGKKNQPINARKSIQGEMNNQNDDGLYILDNGKIFIKTNGRSITSLLDELAFKLRFNYLVATPIPKERLAIFDRTRQMNKWKDQEGMTFDSIQDFFSFLENFMNFLCKKNNSKICEYKISNNDDGIVISSNIQDYNENYKKIFLYNLTVADAQKSIKEFIFKDSSIQYSIIPIPTQNALIVKSNQKYLDQIGEVIYVIDAESPQVMIESQVFEYDDTIGRNIGLALDYAKINGDFTLGVKTIFGEGVSELLPQITGKLTDEEKKRTILGSLALQDRNGGVKILAEPRLVLKPGKEASIKLNTEKYVIVSGVNDSSLEKIETGIVFKITPVILSDSTILLKLYLEQSEFIPTNEEKIVQSSNKNLIETSIVVNDGELISIGGIYLSKATSFSSGIPFIKNIPVIGKLFGSDTQDSSRTMIEFMIRPTIKKLHSKLNHIKSNTYKMYFDNTKKKSLDK